MLEASLKPPLVITFEPVRPDGACGGEFRILVGKPLVARAFLGFRGLEFRILLDCGEVSP